MDNTLVLIHEAVKDVRTGLEEEMSRTEEILTEPLRTAIAAATSAQETQLASIETAVERTNTTFATKSDEVKATITTMLTGVQTTLGAKLDALLAKTWNVNVNVEWPEHLLPKMTAATTRKAKEADFAGSLAGVPSVRERPPGWARKDPRK